MGILAEELGFYAVTTNDHVCSDFNHRYHNSGGCAETLEIMQEEGFPVTNIYETMSTLSVLAGKTNRIKLIPCSVVLPWRNPILFAKQAITLHELSDGRFVCSIVIGNVESDFQSMNVKFKQRGKIMDEHLKILQQIFSSDREVSFEGRFIHIPSLEFYPKPTKKIPIWIGGSFIEKVLNRVAKFGDGFLPAGLGHLGSLERGIPQLRDYLQKEGRNMDEIEIGINTFMSLRLDDQEAKRISSHSLESFFLDSLFDRQDANNPLKTRREVLTEGLATSSLVGSPHEVIKRIEKYVSLGISFFDIVLIDKSIEDVLRMMKLFASDVMPSFNQMSQ